MEQVKDKHTDQKQMHIIIIDKTINTGARLTYWHWLIEPNLNAIIEKRQSVNLRQQLIIQQLIQI